MLLRATDMAADETAPDRLLDHIVSGQYDAAERLLNSALSKTIANGHLWQLRGMVHFARGRFETAMTDFETAASCGLDNEATNLAFRLQTLQAMGRLDDAHALRGRLRLASNGSPAVDLLCGFDALHRLPAPVADSASAAPCPSPWAALTAGSSRGPAVPSSALHALAQAHAAFELCDWDGAEEQYEALVQAYPQHGSGWFGRGLARLRNGRLAQARTDLEVAVQHSRLRCEAAIALGWACIAESDAARAHEAFEFGLAHCARSLPALSGLAAAFALQGMRQPARETIRAVRLQDRASLGAEMAQGLLRLAGGTPKTASRSLSNRLVEVGRICAKEGQQRLANECFSLARLSMCNLAQAHVELAILLGVSRLA